LGIPLFPAAWVAVQLNTLAGVLFYPSISGPNIYSGLHMATGCRKLEENPWPLNGSVDVAYSCSYLVESEGSPRFRLGLGENAGKASNKGSFVVLETPTGAVEREGEWDTNWLR